MCDILKNIQNIEDYERDTKVQMEDSPILEKIENAGTDSELMDLGCKPIHTIYLDCNEVSQEMHPLYKKAVWSLNIEYPGKFRELWIWKTQDGRYFIEEDMGDLECKYRGAFTDVIREVLDLDKE